MKTHIAMLLGVLTLSASARTLYVTPGSLSELLAPDASSAPEVSHSRTADDILVLTGSIDARDFETLRSLSLYRIRRNPHFLGYVFGI